MWFLLQLSIMLFDGMSPIFGVLVKLKRVSVKYVRSSLYITIVYICGHTCWASGKSTQNIYYVSKRKRLKEGRAYTKVIYDGDVK